MSDDSGKLVWLGAAIAVVGQFIGATSMLLIKRATITEAGLPFWQRRTFQFGFLLFFFNTVVLDAIVYALTPLTVVAPITSLGIVFVNIGVAFGVLVAREHFGKRGLLANVMIVVGLIMASSCGPHSNTSPTLDEMYELARAPGFLAYAVPGICIALSCCVLLWLRLLPPQSHLKTVWCATAAAIFGSFSVLFFKAVATVVRLALEGNNQFGEVGTWLLLLGAVICAPANVTLMNLTFEESDAAYGMPLYQAIILLATMVSGGLFYNEFSTWIDEVTAAGEPGWIVGFVTGIVTLVMGIVLVATTRGSHVVGGEEPTPRGATKPCYTALV